jgi:hypothetical protein
VPEELLALGEFVVAKGFIRRGQDNGDFDAILPSAWLLTPALALGRAAEDEVKVGRMTIEGAARRAPRLRVCSASRTTPCRTDPRNLVLDFEHAGEPGVLNKPREQGTVPVDVEVAAYHNRSWGTSNHADKGG